MHGLATPLDQRADALLGKVQLQFVAMVGLDFIVLVHIKVVGVARSGRQDQSFQVAQPLLIEGCDGSAQSDDLVQALQTEIQYGGLKIVKTRVPSPRNDLPILVPPVIPQLTHSLVDSLIVRYNRTPVTQTAEDLSWVKADGGGSTEGPGASSFEHGPQCLRRIFDDQQTVLVRYGLQRMHVASAAVQLSRQEGPGPRRHRGFHGRRVDQVIGPALYRDGRGAGEGEDRKSVV